MQTSLRGLNESQFAYEWVHPDPRMDRLHKEVSVLVERAVAESEGPGLTFLRIRELACRAGGSQVPERTQAAVRIPACSSVHLTEPWFC
jgi:hypothetical protein